MVVIIQNTMQLILMKINKITAQGHTTSAHTHKSTPVKTQHTKSAQKNPACKIHMNLASKRTHTSCHPLHTYTNTHLTHPPTPNTYIHPHPHTNIHSKLLKYTHNIQK